MNIQKSNTTKTFKSALFLSTALIGAVLTGPALAGQPIDARVQKLEATILELQRELDTVKQEQAAIAAKPAAAESNVVFKGGPAFEAADGSWSFKVRGRIEADAAFYDKDGGNNPVDLNDGTELRRARIGVEGKFAKDYLYRLEADFAKASRNDNTGNEVDVKDAFIAYTGLPNTRITVGQHKTPNSLEQLVGSADLVFAERPLAVEAFNHRLTAGGDFKAGVSVGYTGENYTLTTGVFGSNFAVNSNTAGGAANDEGWGVHGRATWAPIQEKGKVLHLGASGYWRDAGGQNGFGGTSVRFRSTPEVSAVDSSRFVDTGNLAADTYTSYGAELGGVWGPFHAQAEYLTTSVDQTAGLGSLDFDGGYVQLGYVLTGESRNYKNGLFSRVKPTNPFSLSNGGAGAWEVAARFSTVDLNDGAVLGGSQDNYAGAINWYLNDSLRIGLNYVNFDAERAGVTTKGNAIVTRIGVTW